MQQESGAKAEKGLQDSDSGPVPMPRPRQQPPQQRTGTVEVSVSSGDYEPLSVNYVNTTLRPPSRPVPAPRLRRRVFVLVDDEQPLAGPDPPGSYQNVVILRNITVAGEPAVQPPPAMPAPPPDVPAKAAPPPDVPAKAAPPPDVPAKAAPANNLKVAAADGGGKSSQPASYYAPSAPPLPSKVNNNLHYVGTSNGEKSGSSGNSTPVAPAIEADRLSEGSGDSGTGGAKEASSSSKYKTSSPGDLFKSIGTTTRMLTEAIGERVAHKTKKAAHNVRSTGSSLVSWGSKATSRSGGKGMEEAPPPPKPTKTESAGNDEHRSAWSPPQALPSPEVMQKIRFGSPLKHSSKAAGANAVGDDDGPPQTTYDVPRRGNKPSNLGRSTPDAGSSGPSTASSSARASSCSMASSGAGGGLFQRNVPVSQSLYSRVLPKHARRQGSPRPPNAATKDAPKVARGEGALVRSGKHKSESNLYESTFYVERPVPTSDSATHLYGKLNIIARPSLSSTSSEEGAPSNANARGEASAGAAGAGSDEDNTLPELLRTGVQLREQQQRPPQSGSPSLSTRATYSSTTPAAGRAIFSRCFSPAERPVMNRSISEQHEQHQHQHRSDSWNYYDIAAAEAKTAAAEATHGEEGKAGGEGQEKEEEEELEYDTPSVSSTPEPVYANDERRRPPPAIPIYGQLADMESRGVLMPLPAGATGGGRHDYDEVSIADIIDEFDPLVRVAGGGPTSGANLENTAGQGGPAAAAAAAGGGGGGGAAGRPVDNGNLSLIENLLDAEMYRRHKIPTNLLRLVPLSEEDSPPRTFPKPPKRSDSLLIATGAASEMPAPVRAVPPTPNRSIKPRPPVASVIVHQNLNLPGSLENLVELDERVIAPHLATVDDEDGEGAAAAGPAAAAAMANADGSVDLSYPKPPQSSWYLEADEASSGAAAAAAGERFEKRLNVDPINERSNGAGRAEKAAKSSLPSELAGPGSSQPARLYPDLAGNHLHDDGPLPSYFEAIGGTDPLFERGLAATPPPPPKASSSVATKLLKALKRRPSLKSAASGGGGGSTEAGGASGSGGGGGGVRTALEMVPRPRLTERFISHKGHVLKFPSGKIGDVLNELAPRSVVLRERVFQTYLDPQQTLPKESIQLRFIMSVQCILQHKFAGEGRLDLHCFEIVLGLPKGGGEGAGGGADGGMSSTNPDLLITSGTSGNAKLTRQSYMFGTHKRSDRNLWMARVLQSVTDVFGGEGDLLREFQRAGWCYVKKSVSAGWAGAWLLLAKRRLYLYSFAEGRREELDLRKVRCIGAIESEPASIGCLHVEAGPSLFIDCPPYATLYFIMGSSRETQIWHKMIRQVAHKNGLTLHSQQLTRIDVPVLIDKCVNFIYAHGSMSEGIYRKSGSATAVTRILQLFSVDAFDVQLTRNEYNEYDVAGALKKFVRELPGSFFGSYAASFVAIGSLRADVQLKVDSYRQLLGRLPRIEYCTLKKLVSHLAFIASLERHNRMGVTNLAMIWGSTLLANASQNTVQEPGSYHQQDADVVADLIQLYPRLFPVDEDELRKDQLMLAVLQKYHAAAENLSDTVKHSGDLKVWITIDCNAPSDGHEETAPTVASSAQREEKLQVNVDITPVKTASDVCKELASKTKIPWYKLTLYEVIANGALIRPVHYREKVLEIVVRWTYWDEADRKHNYLTLKPTTTLNDVYRTIQKAPVLTPTMELKFADRKTKGLRSFQLQLIGRGLVVLKKIEKKDKGFEELLKIDLSRTTAYIGCEPKRDRASLRWAITLVDNDFKKRTRDAPYIGHIFGGLDFASQILWYSSILYSHYKDDILPSGDLFF